jgi:hypothetical protein
VMPPVTTQGLVVTEPGALSLAKPPWGGVLSAAPALRAAHALRGALRAAVRFAAAWRELAAMARHPLLDTVLELTEASDVVRAAEAAVPPAAAASQAEAEAFYLRSIDRRCALSPVAAACGAPWRWRA